MLTEKEKKVIMAIQGDIPLVPNPYELLAKECGMEEEEFVAILKKLDEKKIIRRYGATLRHQKSGFTANAMVAWKAPEETILETGKTFAGFGAVSHCYRRDPKPGWPYNLYTMVHAKSREDCEKIVRTMSEAVNLQERCLLFSTKELKKTSMRYFGDLDLEDDN